MGLSSQDLNSLAKANAKHRLPELKHLDISDNDELKGYVRYLFEHGCKWEKLLHLNMDGKVPTRYSQFVRLVQSGCLQSLEFLRFSAGQDFSQHTSVTWPSLQGLHISSSSCSKGELISAVYTLVEQGEFPFLNTVCLNAQLLPERRLESSLESMDRTLTEALNSCLVESLANDIMDELYDNPIIDGVLVEFQHKLSEIYRSGNYVNKHRTLRQGLTLSNV